MTNLAYLGLLPMELLPLWMVVRMVQPLIVPQHLLLEKCHKQADSPEWDNQTTGLGRGFAQSGLFHHREYKAPVDSTSSEPSQQDLGSQD